MRGLFFTTLTVLCGCQSFTPLSPSDQTLQLLDRWLGGEYSNASQIAEQVADGVAEDRRHGPSHQTVTPIEIDALDGLTYVLTASADGTPDTIVGRGIYHAYPDPTGTQVILRLRRLKDDTLWQTPDALKSLTLEDMSWTEGCAFYLTANDQATRVSGAMKEQACFFGEGDKKVMHHDEFTATETEIWSNGRFYNMSGELVFGNLTGTPVKHIKQ